MYFESPDANLIRPKQPEKLHHQDLALQQSGEHPEQHDHSRRATSNLHRDGQEKPERNMELHQPRGGEPQRDTGDVQELHRARI